MESLSEDDVRLDGESEVAMEGLWMYLRQVNMLFAMFGFV